MGFIFSMQNISKCIWLYYIAIYLLMVRFISLCSGLPLKWNSVYSIYIAEICLLILRFVYSLLQDSVKMELLFTVRKEVKQLKSQVALLQIHNQHLEEENKILRNAAAPEILAMLGSVGSTSTSS